MSNSPTIFPYRKGGPYVNGHIPIYRRASCSVASCHRSISWPDLTKGGAADSVVAAGMRQRNWFIDLENERHICAQCQGLPALKGPYPPTAKTPKTEVPNMFFKPKPKNPEAPTSVSVAPTPIEVNFTAPTPSELRTIRKLLDDVYDLEGQRYREDYSDRTVALIANVPEHWVTIERELAYGPAGSPETEAEAQVRMLDGLVKQARYHAEEAEAVFQLVEEKVDAIKKKLAS